jgi:ABC-2 type transport system permease protein
MFRDFLFIFMTILSIVFFVGLYWLLPKNVDETISLGVMGTGVEAALSAFAGEEDEGLGVSWYNDGDELKRAVAEKDIEIGVAFPDGFIEDIRSGNQVTVKIFARPNLPSEISDAMSSFVREISYILAGYSMPVSEPAQETVVLGMDRAGEQLSIRDKLKPLYAFLLLIIEAIALGTLIASEIQHRTVTAVLATPARLSDLLAAKGVIGTLLAFTEAALVLLLIRGFGPAPGIVLLAIFLGAIMVTGVAMISGSAGKDLVATMLFGMIFLIPLTIPAFAVLIPGAAATWVRILPSYGLVQAIVGTSFYGYGWAESAQYLLTLAGWCVAFAAAGLLILRRRVKTL